MNTGKMSLEEVFKELMRMDHNGTKTIEIDDNGVYQYLFNSPTTQEYIDPQVNNRYAIEKDRALYVIPRNGDLLLTVQLSGRFQEAILYQYDWTGSHQIVYERLESDGVMNPFPMSGFPLLQCGKALYLEVSDPQDVSVQLTYAFLETGSRRLLAQYVFPNTEHGIKAIHRNGDTYQAVNVFDHGYSPNYFALLSKA